MTPLKLDSCRAKLIRAKVHRHALQALEPRLEIESPTIGIKFDSATGEHVVYISKCPDHSSLFLRASLILGDTIQSLRGALDHLVYALADWRRQGNIVNPDQTQFPICDNPTNFNSQANRYLKEIHPLHVAVIERFQTYNALDLISTGSGPSLHPFGLLRDLSNTDKHRILNVVVIPTNVTITTGFQLVDGVNRTTSHARWGQPAELGTEVYRFVRPDRLPDVEVIGSIGSSIALPNLPTRPLFSIAEHLERNVSQVIRLFEPLTR